jgi:hypothetical protein
VPHSKLRVELNLLSAAGEPFLGKYYSSVIMKCSLQCMHLLLFPFGRSGTESTITEASYSPVVPALNDDECGAVGGMFDRGNRNTLRKPASVRLCPPQIPHDLTRALSRAGATGFFRGPAHSARRAARPSCRVGPKCTRVHNSSNSIISSHELFNDTVSNEEMMSLLTMYCTVFCLERLEEILTICQQHTKREAPDTNQRGQNSPSFRYECTCLTDFVT